MPRRCKFDKSILCGYSDAACPKCAVRKRLKQQLLIPEPKPTIHTEVIELDREFTCPYCLYTAPLTQFRIKLKKGYSEKRFQCPDCKTIMKRETLTKTMTVKEFAEWILETHAWERIHWEKFKQRLKQMGIAKQFWKAYKEYKQQILGETETYEEYPMRKQREWMQENELQNEVP